MSLFGAQPSRNLRPFTTGADAVGAPVPADQNSEAANAMLRSAATGELGQKAEQWLDQFGKARVQLNVNDDFHLDGSAFDLLIPLYDKPKEMLFSQWGYRNQDSRNTINIGAGSRTWVGNWMYGMNAFYDEDVTAHNRRLGVGLEAWRDYLKLSANNYFRLSDWRDSRDLEDYNERPANGYDIRAEAYLPSYPQLGGKLIFEQYRGDNVALFGPDNLQKNPYAVTFGVNYTPISLVTLGVDYRQGKGDMNDTTFNLQMNYRLGASWQSQISPDSVAAMRTLAGTRYDLVDRNYNIVLQYQKQQVIELRLPAHLTGYESDPLTVTAEVTSKYALDHIDWNYAAITAAGGTVTQSGQNVLIIKLPPYQHAAAATNIYNLSAVAYDVKKNASNTAVSRIEVLPVAAQITAANLTVTKNDAVANGSDYNQVQAKVTDAAGNPVAGQTVTFTATNGAEVTTVTGTTGANGLAIATLTNRHAGTSVVTATVNGNGPSVNTNFIADASTATLAAGDLTVTRNLALASGDSADTNAVKAVVRDANGNVLAGQSVTFTATNGAVVVTATVVTGADGSASTSLYSRFAGNSEVTATLANGSHQSVTVTFVLDVGGVTITLSVVRTGAVANGIATNEVQAVVRDAAGNLLEGQTVSFTADLGEVTTVIGTTGANGVATATITSRESGPSSVTAALTNGRSQTEVVNFIGDVSTAHITLSVVLTDQVANGIATNQVKAVVRDANNNLLTGQTVTFNATDVLVSPVVEPTGSDGSATASFASHVAGPSTVTATLASGGPQQVTINFIADVTTARVVLSIVHTGAVANGIETNAVSAHVTDAFNNNLDGQTVTFTASNGTPTAVINPTGTDGIATATLVSDTAGPSTVTATLTNGQDSAVVVTFAPNAVIAGITLATTDATADGRETNSVRVLVHDAAGNPAPGVEVTLTSTTAGGTFHVVTPAGTTTGPDGSITIEYTYTLANAINVVATLTGTTETATSSGGVFTIPTVQMTVVDDGTVSGSLPAIVNVTLISARGQPLPDTLLNVSVGQIFGTAITPFPAATASSPVTTNGAGQATLTATSTSTGSNLVFVLSAPGINEGMGGASEITDRTAIFFFF
ncbi:inverse autotransporter beta domain-containing protein [Acerihabitans sp. KWT182]|uniref:Inverse autotransporter beta domain-containing protein n=1 Tax=Acerihabitans sp. KWT182 TaxID=3157919 RepID=A0AAU7Q7X9_9GAMM